MNTPFQDIYEKFLSLIEDYTLSILSDEDLEYLLSNYLDRAISLDFKQCTKDLGDYDDTLNQFNMELSSEEQWIIANGMVLSWIEPKIKREKLLRETISDRDYRESSHANQLKELGNLDRNTRSKLKAYIVSYTENNFNGFY